MTEPNAEHTKCGRKWVSRGNRTGHCGAERWLRYDLLPVGNSDAILATGFYTLPLEGSPNGGVVAANLFRNLVRTHSGFVQHRRPRPPVKAGVQASVFLGGYGDKIFGSIVGPDAVDVVNLITFGDPTLEDSMLVGFEVRSGSDFPPESDIPVGAEVTRRFVIGNSLARREGANASPLLDLPTGLAELLIGASLDEFLAYDALQCHDTIIHLGTLCHATLEGITLFDKHQRVLPDGSVECLDPATIEFPTGYPLKQDEWGTWSSTKKFELKEVRGSVVEVSPGGVGFIRTTATREIPGQTEEMRNAKRRNWIEGEE